MSTALFTNNCSVQASKKGFKLVKEFLSVEHKEDDSEKQDLTWDEFEDCTVGNLDHEYFRDFLSVFDRTYKKTVGASSELNILAAVLAFMALKCSNKMETQIILVIKE